MIASLKRRRTGAEVHGWLRHSGLRSGNRKFHRGKVRLELKADDITVEELFARVDRVMLSEDCLQVTLGDGSTDKRPIEIPWMSKGKNKVGIQHQFAENRSDPKLLKGIVRAHAWARALCNGKHASIEELAVSSGYNPKVVRLNLRLAFLAPEILTAALRGDSPILLKRVPKMLPLSWREQQQSLGSNGTFVELISSTTKP